MQQIRILDPEKFKESEKLAEEAVQFTQRISSFSGMTKTLLADIGEQAKKIEKEKMVAIGIRSRMESEGEVRRRKEQALRAAISEKQSELARLRAQYESLVSVEQEQKVRMEKLGSNEA